MCCFNSAAVLNEEPPMADLLAGLMKSPLGSTGMGAVMACRIYNCDLWKSERNCWVSAFLLFEKQMRPLCVNGRMALYIELSSQRKENSLTSNCHAASSNMAVAARIATVHALTESPAPLMPVFGWMITHAERAESAFRKSQINLAMSARHAPCAGPRYDKLATYNL